MMKGSRCISTRSSCQLLRPWTTFVACLLLILGCRMETAVVVDGWDFPRISVIHVRGAGPGTGRKNNHHHPTYSSSVQGPSSSVTDPTGSRGSRCSTGSRRRPEDLSRSWPRVSRIATDNSNSNSKLRRFLSQSDFFTKTLAFSIMAATIVSLAPIAAAVHASDDAAAISTRNYHQWDLLNGSVTLTEPIQLQFRIKSTGTDRSVTLRKPQIVGAGGGGAVFAFDQDHQPQVSSSSGPATGAFQERDLLLKISWEGTSKTVQRECTTLQLLEDRHVQTAERCLGAFDYQEEVDDDSSVAASPSSPAPPRTMILVAPYMRDAVSSLAEVENETARIVAVDQIARTLVQMLAANVITIDVQPLISKTTGQTIFIDMTEAQVLSTSKAGSEYSFLDQTLISSFTSEMVALIPEDYWKIAKQSIVEEMNQMQNRGTELSKSARSILQEQTPFFVDD